MVAVVTLFFFLIPHSTDKGLFMLAGYVILTVGVFLTGPSSLFGLPNQLGIMTAGMVIAGIGKSLVESLSWTYIMNSGE